jgi:hypothetical protein
MIEVYHCDSGEPKLVARIDCSGWEFDNLSFLDVLEYSYRWTQNIEGSWSLKDWDNEDLNDLVEVIDADSLGGVGYRSTMVGDRIATGGRVWEVSSIGFREIVG